LAQGSNCPYVCAPSHHKPKATQPLETMLGKLICCALMATALGEITWTPTDLSSRRLALATSASHNDTSNANCIVGGYDTVNPTKIYIGGPCSELLATGPSANFKWVEMQTVHLDIVDSNGTTAPFKGVPNSEFVWPKEETSHVEVGVGASQYLEATGMEHAALFASTTSYLAKATFTYTQNDFTTGVTNGVRDISTQCIVPCCADPGANGCACATGCPTQGLQATPGMYKYSIMAAAYDYPSVTGTSPSTYVAGPTGNGWQKVVATYGTGTPKVLAGVSMDTYQVLDFTNMKADTLTVTAPDGTSIKYMDMGLCDLTATGGDCPTTKQYGVASIKVSSDGDWGADYAFPQTSNVGGWTSTAATTVSETRKVLIHGIKLNAATLIAWGMAADTTAAATKKIVVLRYRFDISGITANGVTSGKFMNYDPSISSSSASATTSGGAAGISASAATRTTTRTLALYGSLAMSAIALM